MDVIAFGLIMVGALTSRNCNSSNASQNINSFACYWAGGILLQILLLIFILKWPFLICLMTIHILLYVFSIILYQWI